MTERYEDRISRPAELAGRLNVSPSTLRRWSRQFAEFLSAEASDPPSAAGTDNGHRRYSADDEAILRRVKSLLDDGFSAEQVSAHLNDYRRAQAHQQALQVTNTHVQGDVDGTTVPPVVQMLAESLRSLGDNQQAILGGQQSQRELIGVIVQDNFNLKDENARLRERMLELERMLGELTQRLGDFENRLTVSEAVVAVLQQRSEQQVSYEAIVEVQTPAPAPRKSLWRRVIGGA